MFLRFSTLLYLKEGTLKIIIFLTFLYLLYFQPCYIWKRALGRISYFQPFFLLFFQPCYIWKRALGRLSYFPSLFLQKAIVRRKIIQQNTTKFLLLFMTYPLYLDINRKDKLLRPHNGGNLLVYSINHFISFILWRVKNIKDFIKLLRYTIHT